MQHLASVGASSHLLGGAAMPISVDVHLLSGKSVTLEAAEDASVDTLNLRDFRDSL